MYNIDDSDKTEFEELKLKIYNVVKGFYFEIKPFHYLFYIDVNIFCTMILKFYYIIF